MNAVGDGASPLNGGIGRDLPGQARLARLAEEQVALRRVATLVARGAAPEEVFTAVAGEVGRLLPVDQSALCRYEPDGTLTFVSQLGQCDGPLSGGQPVDASAAITSARWYSQTGRPARADYSAKSSSGPLGVGIRRGGPALGESGRRSSLRDVCGARFSVVFAAGRAVAGGHRGATWSRSPSWWRRRSRTLKSHAALTRLAEEQAALRRVATLVAQGVASVEIFSAVSDEDGPALRCAVR